MCRILVRKLRSKNEASKNCRIRLLDKSALAVENEQYFMSEKYPLIGRSRLTEFPMALQIIRQVQSTVLSAAPSSDSEVLANVEKAVDYVLDKNDSLLERCHQLIVAQNMFSLPIAGDMSVEKSMQSISQWLLSQMSESSRQICKLPSSLAIRIVWESRRGGLFAQRTAALIGGDGSDIGVDFDKEITARMQVDRSFFRDLLKDCFQVQLMMEYISFSSGLLDGRLT